MRWVSARRACCWIRPGFEGTALTGPKSKREPGRPLWGLAPPEASLERCSAPSVRSGPVILYPLTDQTLAGVSVLFSVCYGPGQVCPAFRFSPVWTRWVQLFGSSWVSLSGLRLFGPGGSSCQVFACLYQVGPALRSSRVMDQVGQVLRSSPVLDQAGRTYLDLLLTGRPRLYQFLTGRPGRPGLSVFDLLLTRLVGISVFDLFQPRLVEISILGLC